MSVTYICFTKLHDRKYEYGLVNMSMDLVPILDK